MRRLACLIAVVLLTQGCGIKGPLYLETPEQRKKAEERRERREAAQQRDRAQDTSAAARQGSSGTPPLAPAATTAPEAERAVSPDLSVTVEPFGPSAPPQ